MNVILLTGDGPASGYPMLAAITGTGARHPARIIVAVPASSASSAEMVAREVDNLVCLKIRSGQRFAVAEAYRHWHDPDDREVLAALAAVPDTHGQRGRRIQGGAI